MDEPIFLYNEMRLYWQLSGRFYLQIFFHWYPRIRKKTRRVLFCFKFPEAIVLLQTRLCNLHVKSMKPDNVCDLSLLRKLGNRMLSNSNQFDNGVLTIKYELCLYRCIRSIQQKKMLWSFFTYKQNVWSSSNHRK